MAEDASFVVAVVAAVVASDHFAVALVALVAGLVTEHPLEVVPLCDYPLNSIVVVVVAAAVVVVATAAAAFEFVAAVESSVVVAVAAEGGEFVEVAVAVEP